MYSSLKQLWEQLKNSEIKVKSASDWKMGKIKINKSLLPIKAHYFFFMAGKAYYVVAVVDEHSLITSSFHF